MPELPEVENIRLGLQKHLVGHTIQEVDVRLPKMLSGDPQKILAAQVMGVRRFGKGLVIDLSNNYSIAIHVKMTGQLIYVSREYPANVHSVKVGSLPSIYTHVIIHLDQGAVLYYNDIRQFGWIKIVATEEVLELPFFKDLGPEPLSTLTREAFSSILVSRRTPIKTLLMDQKMIAGIGNIYANDALFLAGIHPKRSANSLTMHEVAVLFSAIETVLKKGIEVGGASEWQYVNALGQTGGYQNFFQVYGKDGKKCPTCGTTIERITMGGRGTFLCPHCQH